MRLEVLALLLAALCGCAGNGASSVDITKPITGDAATNAEKAYKKGLEERGSSNFIEATRYFEWVKNNFPYSQYAALSELALADMAFDRADFETSATSYQDFVKSHPSHPKAGFAAFRVGLAHFKDRASDWFLLPPSYEKDEAPVRQALDALQRFTINYPKSELQTEAKKIIGECREQLAAHERYVADFYWKRKAWKGAAGRLLGLADTYGDLDNGKIRGEALWRASEAYRNVNDPADERLVLTRFLQEAPSDPHYREAQQRLSAIPRDEPKPAAAEGAPKDAAAAPLTPAETPNNPKEPPIAAPEPGQAPGASEPRLHPQDAPAPSRPTTAPAAPVAVPQPEAAPKG